MWKPMLFMGKIGKGEHLESANGHTGKKMSRRE